MEGRTYTVSFLVSQSDAIPVCEFKWVTSVEKDLDIEALTESYRPTLSLHFQNVL